MNTDRWYYRVFQSAPDLIQTLLAIGTDTASVELDPAAPGDRAYRFSAPELKELSHRLDGVLWPQPGTGAAAGGSDAFPVVVLEVQMHPDPGFHHRLSAQTHRFLQRHPAITHLEVVVITPHQRHTLGPNQPPRLLLLFLEQVHWISLEELSQRPDLDPMLNLLTLPVRPEGELAASSRAILNRRPDLNRVVLPMLVQRFPKLSEAQIMQIAGIPREEIRHTRAVQEWLAEGRAKEAAHMTLRQLARRCAPLSEANTTRIQGLPLEQLEALAEALLDFQGPADLEAWLNCNSEVV